MFTPGPTPQVLRGQGARASGAGRHEGRGHRRGRDFGGGAPRARGGARADAAPGAVLRGRSLGAHREDSRPPRGTGSGGEGRRGKAWGEESGPSLGPGSPIQFCPRPGAIEAQRPGRHPRPSERPEPAGPGVELSSVRFRRVSSRHGCGRGPAGLGSEGVGLAPARSVGSTHHRLLQPGAGRDRAAGAGAATHHRAAAGRHQVSGPPGCGAVPRGVAGGTQEERGAQEAGCQPCHPTQSPERLRRWSAPPAAEPSLSIAVHLFGGSVRREKNPRMRRLRRSLGWAQWPVGPCRIHTEDLSGAASDGASTAPKPQTESTSHLDSAWAAIWEAPPLLCL